MKRSNFDHITAVFALVSPKTVHIVSECATCGDLTTVKNAEEKKVVDLLKQVKPVTSHVPGSASLKITMQNEI